MFIKDPSSLTKKDLVEIVSIIQQILYFNATTGSWDLDKDVLGSDCVEMVADTLLAFGLVPVESMKDWEPPRAE